MGYEVLGNDLNAWAVAVTIGLGVSSALYLLKLGLVRRLGALAARTDTHLDDLAVVMIDATHPLALLLAGVYVGSQWLVLSERSIELLAHLAVATLLLQAASWGDAGVRGWLHHYRLQRSAQDAAATTSTAAIGFVARTALWVVALLMVLDNFGVNITTLIASLGIGGIAVALALQNILGDLFSSLSIVLDKPFVVGDFIVVDDIAGSVEYVGLKTTRIRGLGGEQVVFSNSDLLKSRIRNFKRMQTRRIVFGIGVTYEIGKAKLKAIPGMLRRIVEEQEGVTFDRAHFKSYGASSLDFEVVYFVNTPDYNAYMDVQQAINVALFERFEQEGIDFAYPTRTVHIASADLKPALARVAAPHSGKAGEGARQDAAQALPTE